MRKLFQVWIPILLVAFATVAASAQSFRVQCPTSTITHPFHAASGVDCSQNPTAPGCNNDEPAYNGPTTFTLNAQGYVTPDLGTVNGAIKCQQISGGDGYSTMADGTQTFMFAFGPLSGLADIASGSSGTEFPNVFNVPYSLTLLRGDPATTDGASSGQAPGTALGSSTPFTWNGAVGLAPEVLQTANISDLVQGPVPAPPTGTTPGTATGTCPNPPAQSTIVTAYTFEPVNIPVGSTVTVADPGANPVTNPAIPAGYTGTFTILCESSPVVAPSGFAQYAFQYDAAPASGLATQTLLQGVTVSTPPVLDGHVDPRQIMDIGVMNGNIPGPLLAFDEDDEVFLTLTNVGMIMRPDLFEQHTVHFHGYPNASSFYDGVPDASVAINIGASFTYYYLAPDAGTYFFHCHITPPEHLQMGMVGQLHVRPRQDRVPVGNSIYAALQQQNSGVDLRTACNPAADILCSAVTPPIDPGVKQTLDPNVIDPATGMADLPYHYTYNDGDGSTAYDVEYPIQMHGFDPNFHFVGMTFNPEMFVDMKDKYFLLNGRSYPDTVGLCGGQVTGCQPGPQATVTSDGQMHYSQPMPALINIPVGGRALLRLVNLSVSEYHTLASLGIRMKEVGFNAKLLRDQAGQNTEFYTNSITLGGGESLDVILDASDAGCGGVSGCSKQLYPAGSVFYLYTPQLDHLANDAENFGGMMTEVHICSTVIGTTYGNVCQ